MKPKSGSILETNLTLYPLKTVTFDYVCQMGSSRSFADGSLEHGTMTWDQSKGGIKLTPRKPNDYSHDLIVEQKGDKVSFACRYGGSKRNGFYDAGAVDFQSVATAASDGYSMQSKPCLSGHVYMS